MGLINMSRRILLRHGQSQNNAGETDDFDSNLTERGYYQVQEAALHVKEVMGWEWSSTPIEHNWVGFVSPYLRTLRTAYPIAKRYDVKMIVDTRIGEVPDELQKSLKRSPIPSRKVSFPAYDWSRFPGDFWDMTKREMKEYRADLESFVKELPEFAIIISHMTTVKDLTEILTGMDLRHKEVPNCSVTLVEDDELVFIGRR
jgi:broad specificity phosphatase PhoE